MNRRAVLGLLSSLALPGLAGAAPARRASPPLLPAPRSLSVDLAAAVAARKPLVVMVSLDGCPWCHLVRQNYLGPMRQEQGLAVVQVDMRSKQPVQDFDGVLRTHDQLVRAWGVKSAPTLLFFGRDAREIAPRLSGASGDFYGAYLEQRLKQAQQAIAAGR